jgi:hypothetical protein
MEFQWVMHTTQSVLPLQLMVPVLKHALSASITITAMEYSLVLVACFLVQFYVPMQA